MPNANALSTPPARPAAKKLDVMTPVSFTLKSPTQDAASEVPPKIKVTLCYELLRDQEAIDYLDQHGLEQPALLDEPDGRVAFLHVSKAKQLFHFSKQDDALHPWAKRDLTDEIQRSLPDRPAMFRAACFATCRNADGSHALAVAVHVRENREATRLFFTPRLDAPERTRWIPCGELFDRAALAVSLLALEPDAPGEKVLFFLNREHLGNRVRGDLCRVSASGVAPRWGIVDLNRNGRMRDVRPACRRDDRGFYALTDEGSIFYLDVSVWLRTGGEVRTTRVPYDFNTQVTAIDSAFVEGASPSLTTLVYGKYVNRSGAPWYEVASMSPAQQQEQGFRESTLVSSGAHKQRIVRVSAVAEHGGELSVFSCDRDGLLYRGATRQPERAHGAAGFGPPILLDGDVVDFAAAEDRSSERNELFLIRAPDSGLRFEWGYESQGSWRYDTIKIENEERDLRRRVVYETNAISVKLSLREEQGAALRPRSGDQPKPYTVKLSASESINLRANGRYYHLVADEPIDVELTRDATLLLAIPYTGQGAPLLTVSCPALLESAFTFNPIIDTQRRLQRTSDQQLRDQQAQNRLGDKLGGPLVPDSVGAEAFRAGVKGTRNLIALALNPDNLRRDPAADSGLDAALVNELARDGVFLHANDARQASALDLRNLRNRGDYEFGFEVKPGGEVIFYDGADATAQLASSIAATAQAGGNFWTWAADAIAHLWQNLTRAVSNGVKALFKIVDDGIHLIIEAAGRVINAVLDTLESLGQALKNLLGGLLEIAEDAFINYFAVYLPWKDIRGVYDLTETIFEVGTKKLHEGVVETGRKVDEFLAGGEQRLKDVRDALRGGFNSELSVDRARTDGDRWRAGLGRADEQKSWLEYLLDNPVFDWIKTHLLNALDLVSFFAPQFEAKLTEGADRFFNQDLKGFLERETQTIKSFFEGLRFDGAIKGNTGTLVDLFLSEAGLAFIRAVRGIVGLLFDAAKALGQLMIDCFFDVEVNLPFLTAMFHNPRCLGRADEKSSVAAMVVMALAIPVGCILRFLGFSGDHLAYVAGLLRSDASAVDPPAVPYWAIAIPEVIEHSLQALNSLLAIGVMVLDEIEGWEAPYQLAYALRTMTRLLGASAGTAVALLKDRVLTGGVPWTDWVGLGFQWIGALVNLCVLCTRTWAQGALLNAAKLAVEAFKTVAPMMFVVPHAAEPGTELDSASIIKKVATRLLACVIGFVQLIAKVVSAVIAWVRTANNPKPGDWAYAVLSSAQVFSSFARLVGNLVKAIWPAIKNIKPWGEIVGAIIGGGAYASAAFVDGVVVNGLSIAYAILESQSGEVREPADPALAPAPAG